jgi:predicted homoserine dehydrogenase-like protein
VQYPERDGRPEHEYRIVQRDVAPMSLYAKLQQRAQQRNPLRIGLIGAGKFGAMYLAQIPRTPGVHLAGIADLMPSSARANLERVGWKAQRHAATSLDDALATGATHLGDDGWRWCVIRESTSWSNALATNRRGRALPGSIPPANAVNVTVEADLLRPTARAEGAEAGVIYSLSRRSTGADLRTCRLGARSRLSGCCQGAATSGCRISRNRRRKRSGVLRADAGAGEDRRLNPKMFNSFLDGSKPAIEHRGVQRDGLVAPPDGLATHRRRSTKFRPCASHRRRRRAASEGAGRSHFLERDGTPIGYDIRFWVFVVFEAIPSTSAIASRSTWSH